MLMSEATGVNVAPPRAVMLSIGEIAARDGVSKPAVSRKVGQLVERHGLTVERDGQGRVARVNVAEYDHLRGRFDDPSKVQAPAAPIPSATQKPGETYDEALRQRTWRGSGSRRSAASSCASTRSPMPLRCAPKT